MQRLKVVIDTNILVSAILTPKGPSAKIVSAILEEMIELCISSAIYQEYHRVLNYERFKLNPLKVERFLTALKNVAQWFTPTKTITKIIQDDFDNRFLECAEEAEANFLITETEIILILSVLKKQLFSVQENSGYFCKSI